MRCPGPRLLGTSWTHQPAPFTSTNRISTDSVTTGSGRRRQPAESRRKRLIHSWDVARLPLLGFSTHLASPPPLSAVASPLRSPPPQAWQSTPAFPIGSWEYSSYLSLLCVGSVLRLAVSPEDVFRLPSLAKMRFLVSSSLSALPRIPQPCFKPTDSSP